MFHSRFFVGLHQLALLVALSACGGGGGGAESGSSPTATIRTLAYAPFECRENDTQVSAHQELRIQQGEGVPVTVIAATEAYLQMPPVLPGACRFAGMSRTGLTALFAGGVQRLGVSPDGSTVVFEKTNRFSVVGLPQLASDREGFFLVRADGSGLRRLGPASRESLTRLAFDASVPGGLRAHVEQIPLSVSADGRTIVFTDRGPGPADEDAAQIVTMDLATGERTQVTRMPRAAPANPPDPVRRDVCCPSFLPDGTIIFFTYSNPNGLDPEGAGRIYTVRPDGGDLKLVPLPIVLPGSTIDPTLQITGDRPTMLDIGGLPGGSSEVFLYDGGNLLQLSNLHRPDTRRGTLAVGEHRALFVASADPFGTNPSENCQIFSVDTLGTDLRQLTDFSQGEHSPFGCDAGGPPGCAITYPLRRDPVTGVVVFASSCDPFSANPNGEQIFAMNPDSTRLRQLTNTRGFTTEANGTVDVELPGPFASTAVEH